MWSGGEGGVGWDGCAARVRGAARCALRQARVARGASAAAALLLLLLQLLLLLLPLRMRACACVRAWVVYMHTRTHAACAHGDAATGGAVGRRKRNAARGARCAHPTLLALAHSPLSSILSGMIAAICLSRPRREESRGEVCKGWGSLLAVATPSSLPCCCCCCVVLLLQPIWCALPRLPEGSAASAEHCN